MSPNQDNKGAVYNGSQSRSLLNSPSLDVSDQSAFVELLLMDFSAVLNKETIPLDDNKEYMQLTELKFLLKNVRELTSIQLFQSFSRSDTITYTPSTSNYDENDDKHEKAELRTDIRDSVDSPISDNRRGRGGHLAPGIFPRGNVPELAGLTRRSTDRLILSQRRAQLDAILLELRQYIDRRLALTSINTIVQPTVVDTSGEGQKEIGEASTNSPTPKQVECGQVRRLPRIVELCNRYNFSHSEREIFHLMVVVQGSCDSHVLVSQIQQRFHLL